MSRLVVATGNLHKVKEIRAILGPAVTVETLADHPDIVMPEESGETFEANAILKAEHVSRILGVPALADDSGLEVDALDGAPGVRSARYAPGSDADRVTKLLGALSRIPKDERRARFVCAVALAVPSVPPVVVRGTVSGWITDAPRGSGGFGYDPVFVVSEVPGDRTMSELSAEEKNRISHRGRALALLVPHFSLELRGQRP